MLLGQFVQEDGTQIDIEYIESLHNPQTARTEENIEKFLVKKERNVIGIATEVVGDGRLFKKIKCLFTSSRFNQASRNSNPAPKIANHEISLR